MLYLVEVLPAVRFGTDGLHFFSADDYKEGGLIGVSIRGAIVPGIVVRSTSLGESKADLKRRSFELSRLKAEVSGIIMPESFLPLINRVAMYYCIEPSYILDLALPRWSKIRVFMSEGSRSLENVICVPNRAMARRYGAITYDYLALTSWGAKSIIVRRAGAGYVQTSYPNLDGRLYIRLFAENIGAELHYEDIVTPLL